MQLHQLTRPSTLQRKAQRVGRGQSSGRGKTAGRGTKGQNARSGRKKRPEWRDIIKKLPKRRGFGKNRGRTVVSNRVRPIVVPLLRIASVFEKGEIVSLASLKEKHLVGPRVSAVKIVGGEAITKPLSVSGCVTTASVRLAIEKAGGVVA